MSVRVTYSDPEERGGKAWKIAGAALIGAAVAIGVGVFLARDQMQRHRRDLFSPHPLRRLAALGYLKSNPAVDDVPLLRDYLAWEERPLLRKRATAILSGLEDALTFEEEDHEDAEGA